MKRTALFALLIGAVALTFTANAYAQADSTNAGSPPGQAVGFVDEDGDGINDNSMAQHRQQAMKQRGERVVQASRARLLQTVMEQLTPEQVTQIEELIASLRAEDKTLAEIHTAVGTALTDLGITLPEEWNATPQQIMQQNRLNTQQQEQIRTMVQTMQSAGATPEQIREAVAAQYQEWGKAMPGLQYGNRNRTRTSQPATEE